MELEEIKLRVASLTEGEMQCLRAVSNLKSSKEIARDLNISSHTVDKRLRDACKKIGVSARKDAARIFSNFDSNKPDDPAIRGLVYQSPHVQKLSDFFTKSGPLDEQSPSSGSEKLRSLWSVLLDVEKENNLSVEARLGIIMALAVLSMTMFFRDGSFCRRSVQVGPIEFSLRHSRGINMLKQRMEVAKDIHGKLHDLEEAIDQAIICAAELSASASKGRIELNLSAMVGSDAIQSNSDTLAALIEARGKVIDTHEAFATARDQIGLRTRMGGDLWKPPHAFAKGTGENDEDERLVKAA